MEFLSYINRWIRERPRRYITPSVSLDDIRDKDERKLIIDFIYKSTVNQAAKEVWNDFKESSCVPDVEEREKLVLFYYSNYCKMFNTQMYYVVN